jgi:hypothetical protein
VRSRRFLAAAHVVGAGDELDWEATLAYRRYLWSLGLDVAEAMDTAQRGMGLDWETARELIRRSAAEGPVAAGAGTDHLPPGPTTIARVIGAYLEQVEAVEDAGAQVILMASRALAASAASADEYLLVYNDVLSQVRRPVILHWLGPMFDPQLDGYWGATPMDTVAGLIAEHAAKVDGIKVSLLDAAAEVELRARLPAGVRMYTGDDFNYPELILGGSDALLGIFDAIAPAAAAALDALDAGDEARFTEILAPTVPLARHVFSEPTYNYKTGIVFLAWLNGHQDEFRMIGGLETARPVEHLAETYRLAREAGLIADPELAEARMRSLL